MSAESQLVLGSIEMFSYKLLFENVEDFSEERYLENEAVLLLL